MRLSKRMKKILLLLLRENELNRDQIISYIEENDQLWVDSKWIRPPEKIPPTSIRVTFDRTFRSMRSFGLIELKPEQPHRSRYLGTFLHGHSYQLTEKGRLFATKTKKAVSKQIEEYWDLVKGKKESLPLKKRRAAYCTRCGLWHSILDEVI